jgi:hypothetical protein
MPELAQISFREANRGGAVDLTKAWIDSEQLRGKEHLIVLIHGYNNDRAAGDAAYAAFRGLQQGLAGEGRDWAPGATVVCVYWPGDADWGILSAAYYPWAVPRAQEITSTLSAILISLSAYSSSRLAVDFVAHSLGNRVLLRTLALCAGENSLWIRRVVHMAAAVPTWKLEDARDADRLADGFAREIGPDGRTLSMFSPNDRVLRWAFPLGETFTAARDGLFPTALGHADWAAGDALMGLSQIEARGADHGDYWGSSDTTPAELRDFVSREVQRELDLGVLAARATPATLTLTAHGAPDREAPPGRALDMRGLASRTVGGGA